jgi:glycosyltransferase involved in cell wall biosynthesis
MAAVSVTKRRILYFSHTRQVSGAERVLLNMLSVLDAVRYEVQVACPTEGAGNLDELVSARGVNVIAVPALAARFTSNPAMLARYLGSAVGAVAAFRRMIGAVKPDLIHANSVRAGLVATLATTGMNVPVLWHVQDDLPQHAISSAIRRVALGSKRTSFVAVSAATARAFAGDSAELAKRVRVLHNSVDAERFPQKSVPLDHDAMAFRQELGLGDEDVLFAAVGMVNRRKGLGGLIDAFARIAEMRPEARLAIVGAAIFNNDHLYEAELRTSVHQLGLGERVTFTGSRKHVDAVLRGADVLVLNALVEPFGLVILEAMCSGTPVIATRVGGIPEMVEDGVSGLLVDSPDALEAAMLRALTGPDQMEAMAQRAFTQVVPRFSLVAFGNGLNALYEGILNV